MLPAPALASDYTDVLTNAFAKIASALSAFESFESHTIDQTSRQEARLLFSGRSYRIEFQSRKGGPKSLYSFDGAQTFILEAKDVMMIIRKGEFAGCRTILDEMVYSPLVIFNFAFSRGATNDLEALTKPSFWSEALARTSYLGERDVAGRRYLAVRVANGYDPYTKESVTYDVYLDPSNHMLPRAWEAFDKDGVLVHKISVTGGRDVPFAYKGGSMSLQMPNQLAMWRSLWSGETKVDGKTVKYFPDSTELLFPVVAINGISEADIPLDPSLAESIMDLSAKTIIKVPR